MNKFKNSIFQFALNERGSTRGLVLIVSIVSVFAIMGTYHSVMSHVSGEIPEVKSGISNYCLDDHDSVVKAGALVDAYKCNDTTAQAWDVNMDNIKHENLCMSVVNDAKTSGAKVNLNSCNNTPGQIWLKDKTGFYNPNSQECLNEPTNGGQLNIASCSGLNRPGETWTSNQPSPACTDISGRGALVTCNAEKEWIIWQSGSVNHNKLLNQYTDGASYEEWCADFISYVYKEAGFPFTNGEANGWDESNANNIQYMGYTMHDPSNYTPKPGDVAYFNYEGGHVEIVISGGKTPTFIYGNSASIDPTTGNGEMESNTIVSDGSFGQLTYYLSPN